MVIHQVKIELKPDSFTALSRKIQSKIMPTLRLQQGFCDGVTVIAPERSTATENTRWETKADAEAYQKTGYLEVFKVLSSVAIAAPTSSIFEVAE